ncbi:MAG: type II toxin-antitoxin system PemK/MazF family toxin [Muribaculaceae bacterium]|nr:type II toxin-antitoxin system PemK/MazF family toxin [Muribaculaceae bacterium]
MTTQIKDSGLQFHPRKREILICDFKGNIVPEIVKKRPVVVLRDPLPYRSDLAIVVPLSSTPPLYAVPYCVLLSQNYLSQDDKPMCAKCDLACSVSLKRLDRIKVGKRKYVCPRMNEDDFSNVVRGVGWAFGFAA